ncbi:MAG: hypothetical protein A3B99_01815 [Candidatus Yanofskybacteria bacterium RIFCSPHIGHO2_02_FULL_44_12b]|uniref:Methyltransferase type 11 domain-containing protein n=2 Tax=Candidatus Yanofskyibacteriota TaxID=1752733 RepID=A0A1F8GLY0_9BACT|nr:MAG: hypothetical protein UW79_C0002G0022 [Candidatus Yanofskybacteria bacterium GW2011_GWA2_44_9]OGN05280.1 MAG: hypothetical protein A2659_04995 [Candidatus Yanofskybacteria bacterium RIFCSPHIGHO2_01_FULL_44_24]OGN14979.1 MAG: hypothetical protein A3B99_01815 [Candidatus Yanofskybacteria bacterium RIFCSPHIGHO2_02_FULL_44_12b]OGN26417.1 MAG: hypothetical protein A2925_03525 [Candidatus Yanofskybacteria bacterium RIFCSPLOWO2_01_FULL_44_22]
MERNNKIEKNYMSPEQIPTSDRGLDKYLLDLGLTREELAGKRILDLGSGTRRFAKEVEDNGIVADVFSVDPIFEDPDQKIEKGADELAGQLAETDRPSITKKTVAALGENLPFKDNSFDFILAEYSLPAHAISEKQIDEFFQNSMRSLRVGGELRFCPPVNLQRKELTAYVERKLTELSKQNQYEVIKSGQLTVIKKLQ